MAFNCKAAVAWAVLGGAMGTFCMRGSSPGVIWACWNALLLVYLTALLILLLFPLCLRVFGHTVDYLKNQVFITQRGIAS